MDVVPFFITSPESAILENPRKDTFDDGAVFSQATTVLCISFRNFWNDAPCPKWFTNFSFGIISSIRIQGIWPASSAAAWAFDGWDGTHQRNDLLRVVNIGTGMDYRKGDAFAIVDKMPF